MGSFGSWTVAGRCWTVAGRCERLKVRVRNSQLKNTKLGGLLGYFRIGGGSSGSELDGRIRGRNFSCEEK